ncbi:MAG: ABC transporter ATP-binding protein [Granulosicoccaceae bacterium]
MMLLSGKNLCVDLNNTCVVRDLDIDVQAGELIGLIGPNGAGKSSLLRALAGVLSYTNGSVHLLGKALQDYSPEQRARHLSWLAQSGPINWPLSVERLVMLGRTPHRSAWQGISPTDKSIVEQILEQTDCLSLQHRNATSLSGGERARVLLARALASEPDILLADEPVAALDLAHQMQTMDLLRQFSQGQKGCIVVLHDLSLAARYCDRLVLMDKGQKVSAGNTSEVLTIQALRDVYGVEAEIKNGEYPWVLPKHLL